MSQTLSDVTRTTLLVGDNGSGKTSLLEAIFLTLASSTEVAARLRQNRGLDGTFAGSPTQIEEALWGDYFYEYNMDRAILIQMEGDGPESRSLQMSRGSESSFLALADDGSIENSINAPITFQWTDANKVSRIAVPKVSKGGVELPSTGESLPDFFMIGHNNISASENAQRFSSLSKRNAHRKFVETFIKEYDWIEDINLELHANAPVLYGTLRDSRRKIPLSNISSGINRALSILLCIASRPKSIVIVDEIESGIYYSHLAALWRAINSFALEYECQIIASTHSKECIDALLEVSTNHKDELSIWRTERGEDGHIVRQLTGDDAYLIHDLDEEVR